MTRDNNRTGLTAWKRTIELDEGRRESGTFVRMLEDERRRLALDLHHSTAQSLAALSTNLDLVQKSAGVLDARVRRVLDESRFIATQCLQDVRTLADSLYPPLIDEVGLALALECYVAAFAERTGTQIDFRTDYRTRVSGEIAITLFRVVERCLSEVSPRVSSRVVSISLKETRGTIDLEVRGARRSRRGEPRRRTGACVLAASEPEVERLRDRIVRAGGTFDIAGTTLRVRVPVERAIKKR